MSERYGRAVHENRARWVKEVDGRWLVLSAAPWAKGEPTGDVVRGDHFLAPVKPGKIVCVGRNYRAHAAELGNEVPSEPLLFLKPSTAVCGPSDAIERPAASQQVEHEAELGLVIGKWIRDDTIEEARAAVFGLTCVNDVTARDIQRAEGKFTRAKGFDSFCPVGPHIVTGVDPLDLEVRCTVDGEERQRGRTSQMVFDPFALVLFINSVMTLEPGDLIATGTPAGVGPLSEGSTVTIAVEGVGELTNRVIDRGY